MICLGRRAWRPGSRHCYHDTFVPCGLPLRCVVFASLSATAILAWQELVVRFRYQGLQTGLFCTGSRFPVPPPLSAGTYVFQNSSGYDGQFYRYVAHDPFFRRGFDRYIDDARDRYRRILVPFMAWAMSGGQDGFVDSAYQLSVVAFCALGVYWTCCWLLLSRCPPAWGTVAFLLLPGTLASVDRMLVDGPLCALFAGYMYYSRRGRWNALYAIAAVAPLIRETGILILAGILAAAILEKRWRRVAVFATAAIPALLWFLYVAAHTRPSSAMSIVQRPVIGLFLRLFTIPHNYAGLNESLRIFMQTVDSLSMAGYILCLAMAAKWLWTRRTEGGSALNITVACFLLLGLALGHPVHLLTAYGYGRPLSPLILWVVLVALASRKWAALVPPMLVSGGVVIYLVHSTLRVIETLFRL